MKFFDFNDPFFKPLWIRIAVVAVAGAWGVFEFVSGAPFWGVLFCGLAAAAFYGFFIVFNPRDPKPKTENEE
jgi:hypothetical protein